MTHDEIKRDALYNVTFTHDWCENMDTEARRLVKYLTADIRNTLAAYMDDENDELCDIRKELTALRVACTALISRCEDYMIVRGE